MSNKVALRYGAKWRSDDVKRESDVTFKSFLLSEKVTRGLHLAGFKKPTPIQLKAIPLGRCGLDLVIQAKSGTGKTCVFTVVALESLTGTKALQVLILAPTREIAHQNWSVLKAIGKEISGLHTHVFIGGTPLAEDTKNVKNCQIAVGTPGRIKQLMEMQCLLTGCVRLLVLDEADKLISDRFTEEINWIYNHLPVRKQVLAASATFTDALKVQVENYMRFPRMVAVNENDLALKGVLQFYTVVEDHPMSHIVFQRKKEVVKKIFSRISFSQCIIFCNWITRVDMLYNWLKEEDYPVAKISSNDDQTARLDTMDQLKKFNCKIVVSSDLTARGIDAENVDLVIQLDLAQYLDTYLHRVGRAGRFGAKAISISLITTGFEEQKLSTFGEEGNFDVYLLPDPVPQNLFSWTSDKLRSSCIKTCKGSFSESQEKAIAEEQSQSVDEIAAGESAASSDSELEDELDIENGNVPSSDSVHSPAEKIDNSVPVSSLKQNSNVSSPKAVDGVPSGGANGCIHPNSDPEETTSKASASVDEKEYLDADSKEEICTNFDPKETTSKDDNSRVSAVVDDAECLGADSKEEMQTNFDSKETTSKDDNSRASAVVDDGECLGADSKEEMQINLDPKETTSKDDNSRASAVVDDAECLGADSKEEIQTNLDPEKTNISSGVNDVCANNNNILVNGNADDVFMPVLENCVLKVASSNEFHDSSPSVLPKSVESGDATGPTPIAVAIDSNDIGNSGPIEDVIGTFLLSHSSGSYELSSGDKCLNSEIITKSFDCFFESFDCSLVGKTYEEIVECFENRKCNLPSEKDNQARQELNENELKVLETYLYENKNLFFEGIRQTAKSVLQSLEESEKRDVKELPESTENDVLGNSETDVLKQAHEHLPEVKENIAAILNSECNQYVQDTLNNANSTEQIGASKPEGNFAGVSNSTSNPCQNDERVGASLVLENGGKIGRDTTTVKQGHSSILKKGDKFNCDNVTTKKINVQKGKYKSTNFKASRSKQPEDSINKINTCKPLQSKYIPYKKRFDKSKTSTPLTQTSLPADKCLMTKAGPVPSLVNNQFKSKCHGTKAGEIHPATQSFSYNSAVSGPNKPKFDQQKTKNGYQGKPVKNKYVFEKSKFQKSKTDAKENNYESIDCKRQNREVGEPIQYESNFYPMSRENKIRKDIGKHSSSYKKNGQQHRKANDFSRCSTNYKKNETWNNGYSEVFSFGDVGLQSHHRSHKNHVKIRDFPNHSYLPSHHLHSEIQRNYKMSYDGFLHHPSCERHFQFYWPSHVSLPRDFSGCNTCSCYRSENCNKNCLQYTCYCCASFIDIHPFDLHVFCCDCVHGTTKEDHGLHPYPDDPGYALFDEYMQSLESRKHKKTYR